MPTTIDDYLLSLIGRAMPLGLSTAEILVHTLADDCDGDIEDALLRLSEEVPPRIKLVSGRWKLRMVPAQPKRSVLLGSGRDPGRAFGFGGGTAIVVHSAPRGKA